MTFLQLQARFSEDPIISRKKSITNIQFIVTTHSPQVLGEAGHKFNATALRLDENGDAYATVIGRMDGYDSNYILEEYMGTASQSTVKTKLVDCINDAIRTGDYFAAEEKLQELQELSGEDDAEYILARGYLKRKRYYDLHSA